MTLPDRILTKMNPADRAKLGKAGVTAEEAQGAFVAKKESELQKWIHQLLTREGVRDTGHQQFGAKTSVRPGTPDFKFCFRGVPMAWEIKLPGKKPRANQIECMADLASDGWRVAVIESYDQARLELQIARGTK